MKFIAIDQCRMTKMPSITHSRISLYSLNLYCPISLEDLQYPSHKSLLEPLSSATSSGSAGPTSLILDAVEDIDKFNIDVSYKKKYNIDVCNCLV